MSKFIEMGGDPMKLGGYRGFQLELFYDSFRQEFDLTLKGSMSYRVTLGESAQGNFTRMDNALAGLEDRLKSARERLSDLENQQSAAKAQLDIPFPQEEELRTKTARLAELGAELSMDGPDSSKPEVGGKKDWPSVLAELKARSAQIPPAKHKPGQEVVL